ncbi:MAG: hypothetical protein IPL70_03785 [Uliginosibacterium sp.]|nr:hypothetical protein [Uliginosibacterium sp.]
MKRRIVLAVVLGMVVFGGLSVLAATCVSRTVTTRGEQAVRAMDAEERAAFAQLSLITRDMRGSGLSGSWTTVGRPDPGGKVERIRGLNLQSASCQLCQRAPGQCSLAETRIIHV